VYRWHWIAMLLVVTTGCRAVNATATVQAETIPLPEPRLDGELSLEETLTHRRSVRDYTDERLTLEEIGQLLWAAQGVTRDWGARTAPSAGALYPLELYVVTAEWVSRYRPETHDLVVTSYGERRQELWEASLKQDWVLHAPAVFVIAAVYERTASRYGQRAERYVHMEVGHAAQNLLLQAVALDLGAVPVGAFHDDKVKSLLNLPKNHEPLYLIPVGHPDE